MSVNDNMLDSNGVNGSHEEPWMGIDKPIVYILHSEERSYTLFTWGRAILTRTWESENQCPVHISNWSIEKPWFQADSGRGL